MRRKHPKIVCAPLPAGNLCQAIFQFVFFRGKMNGLVVYHHYLFRAGRCMQTDSFCQSAQQVFFVVIA